MPVPCRCLRRSLHANLRQERDKLRCLLQDMHVRVRHLRRDCRRWLLIIRAVIRAEMAAGCSLQYGAGSLEIARHAGGDGGPDATVSEMG